MQTLPCLGEPITYSGPHYDGAKEAKEFDETKDGVKGLVDSGVTKVPRLFIHPPQNLRDLSPDTDGAAAGLEVPMWGFFQMINHGIPDDVMDGMVEAVKQFHEQPEGVKREWYSGDDAKKFRYHSNGDLIRSKAATWKDTVYFDFSRGVLDPKAVPLLCTEPVFEYERHIEKLKISLIAGHYYPTCPEPELTIGTINHSDASFLTLLLQNHHGSLQVRHQNQWIDVCPVPGAILANIGDSMQSTGSFARGAGPWVSVACFLVPGETQKSKPYGPIKEFLDENSPPMYRETTFTDYLKYCFSSGNGENGESVLPHFRVNESK
ncbi:hypothetical protein ACJRO7_008845 [Eucalyptus globulus]|uniref:Fe2OG dioxygenase domain-containing protein n=1 Tax=Eucalyptus globulus TaxID=34317 RepID=A0ABD3ISE3_EUCGL